MIKRIRNWITAKWLCKWEPSALHIWYTQCGFMPIFRPRGPFCPKCHKLIKVVRD